MNDAAGVTQGKGREAHLKETPILFSGPMVRAILDGRKSMTRRVVKPQPEIPEGWTFQMPGPHSKRALRVCWECAKYGVRLCGPNYDVYWDTQTEWPCPYGVPGDRLVLLASWATEKKFDKRPPSKLPKAARIWSLWDGVDKPSWCGRTRRAMYAPMWVRAFFPRAETTAVRVERLQEISYKDVLADFCPDGITAEKMLASFTGKTFQNEWCESFWDSINGKKHPWASNPWVWVIEFKKQGGV